MRHLKPSWRGELEITEAIQWLIDDGRKVTSTTITGYWKDTGNVTDMLEVNRHGAREHRIQVSGHVDDASELIGRVAIEAGAEVRESRIVGPVIIGQADAGVRLLYRPVHLHRAELHDRRQRDRVLHCAAWCVYSRGQADRGFSHRPSGGGDAVAACSQGPPTSTGRPQQGADQLMKILVTGGAGFIGSHYVRTLLGGGYPRFEDAQVTVLDKLTYAGNLANLEELTASPRFSFIRGDICDASLLASVVPGHDVVVNFAAETHVDRSILGASDFVATNVTGVQVLLQACLDAHVARVVQISTDEVYGSIARGSWAETAPVAPNSPYAAAKAGGDLLARAYARTHGLNISITRCCNNYGPYQYPEKVIPLFVTNLLEGQKVPLYGDGRNIRGWIHVDDHCRGIQLVLSAVSQEPSITSTATWN